MSAFFASSTASHGQIWDVDIYVRASREDGDKEQSETISNQITMPIVATRQSGRLARFKGKSRRQQREPVEPFGGSKTSGNIET